MTISSFRRFWGKVKIGPGCWLWTGCAPGGYGLMILGSRIDGSRRVVRASRVAWFLVRGVFDPGLFVLHECDVPACVRPSHLFLGTHADNMADMARKGRHSGNPNRKGEAHPLVKLSEEDVEIIRSGRLGEQATSRELAGMFGVGPMHVNRIVRGERW